MKLCRGSKPGRPCATTSVGLAAICAVGLIGVCEHHAYATPPAGYNLIWSDEFNQGVGASPNTANWTFDTGAGGWGNQELETYVTDTAHCGVVADSNATDGEALAVVATKDIVHTRTQYHSARLKSASKVMPQYGFVEARIQLPFGQGIWPAFWALGSSNLTGTAWPNCGEMDIMENGGNASWSAVNQGSLHGPGYSGGSCLFDQYTLSSGAFSQGYHLFQMQWSQNKVQYFVDGNLYLSRTANDVGTNTWPYNQPFFFITNVAVGGTFVGSPDATTSFPQTMKIDYIRVYQQPTVPAAPTGLAATGQSNQVALSWSAVSGATGYNVYRGTSPGGESTTPVAVLAQGTSYSDPGLGNGATFYYKVTAVNGAGESAKSTESSATTAAGITTVFADGLSNWIGVSSETSGMGINFSSPDLYFNNDSGRANRASDTAQSITYSYSNISTFTAKLYCWNTTVPVTPSFLTWQVSTNNGASYTTISTSWGTKTLSGPGGSGGQWGYYTITPSGSLPANVDHLKVNFNAGTGNGWDPELSELDITHQ